MRADPHLQFEGSRALSKLSPLVDYYPGSGHKAVAPWAGFLRPSGPQLASLSQTADYSYNSVYSSLNSLRALPEKIFCSSCAENFSL